VRLREIKDDWRMKGKWKFIQTKTRRKKRIIKERVLDREKETKGRMGDRWSEIEKN